ncbi:uncharacterized protein TNCV_145181 [Trichonephila clavipes]|nr:uncharacterized protein TNCV_145181 [Trichonephila clavipes]
MLISKSCHKQVMNLLKNILQEELRCNKKKQYELQTELNNRDYLVEKANGKTEELLEQLKKVQEEHAEEKEALKQKMLSLTEQIQCLEAVNAEQSNQITNEVKQMIAIATAEPNCEFLSNAQAICDKLNLKQEIAKLKATVTQKETVLQQLAQKYNRTTTNLESHLKKAEKEIQVLDNVIEKVFSLSGIMCNLSDGKRGMVIGAHLTEPPCPEQPTLWVFQVPLCQGL